MNWFTHNTIAHLTTQAKLALLEEDGGCEHAERDIHLAVAIRREVDSFGPVSSYVVCKDCDAKAEKEEEEQSCVCNDCKQTFKVKDCPEWRWYDFYAASGDVALHICRHCRTQARHQLRVAKDHADYEDEFGSDMDD